MLSLLLILASLAHGEVPRDGEPSDKALQAIAMDYLDAIASPDQNFERAGLDYLEESKMSFENRETLKFKPITFKEASSILTQCKMYEGWSRRYDRRDERVFAFDSGWKCNEVEGVYTTTVFVEIADGQVVNGRLIEKTKRNVIVRVPVAPARTDEQL